MEGVLRAILRLNSMKVAAGVRRNNEPECYGSSKVQWRSGKNVVEGTVPARSALLDLLKSSS